MASAPTRRADGRYVETFTYVDTAGKRRRRYVYGKTAPEARRRANAARKEVALHAPVRDPQRMFSDWAREWAESFLVSSERKPSTVALYRHLLLNHVVPHLGALRLAEIAPADVVRLLLALEDKGLAPSSRRSVYAVLRCCLNDAVLNGLLRENPAAKSPRPRQSRREARHLTEDEANRLLAATDASRYGRVVRLILGTGLRRGEALALKWSDVNFDRRELRIRGSLVRGSEGLVVSQPKTRTGRRVVALSAVMCELLRAQRTTQATEQLAAQDWVRAGYCFTTRHGGPVD